MTHTWAMVDQSREAEGVDCHGTLQAPRGWLACDWSRAPLVVLRAHRHCRSYDLKVSLQLPIRDAILELLPLPQPGTDVVIDKLLAKKFPCDPRIRKPLA